MLSVLDMTALSNYLSLLRAVPEDSPSNVMVLPFSTSSVLVAWDPPSISNGIITQYILYVDIFDGLSTVVPGNVTQFEVTGLMPYQLVVIEVAAATSVGEGPRGAEADGRSEEEGKENHATPRTSTNLHA